MVKISAAGTTVPLPASGIHLAHMVAERGRNWLLARNLCTTVVHMHSTCVEHKEGKNTDNPHRAPSQESGVSKAVLANHDTW